MLCICTTSEPCPIPLWLCCGVERLLVMHLLHLLMLLERDLALHFPVHHPTRFVLSLALVSIVIQGQDDPKNCEACFTEITTVRYCIDRLEHETDQPTL